MQLSALPSTASAAAGQRQSPSTWCHACQRPPNDRGSQRSNCSIRHTLPISLAGSSRRSFRRSVPFSTCSATSVASNGEIRTMHQFLASSPPPSNQTQLEFTNSSLHGTAINLTICTHVKVINKFSILHDSPGDSFETMELAHRNEDRACQADSAASGGHRREGWKQQPVFVCGN